MKGTGREERLISEIKNKIPEAELITVKPDIEDCFMALMQN
jgi:hypothetical protein